METTPKKRCVVVPMWEQELCEVSVDLSKKYFSLPLTASHLYNEPVAWLIEQY
jgi:hypothetical protein